MAEKVTKSKQKVSKKVAHVDMPHEELKNELSTKQNDLLESKRGHRAGELTNPRAITILRKEIARLKTAIRHHELKGDK